MVSGTIVYLHGFASVGNSVKGQRLAERFGNDTVVSPDLPIDPFEAVKTISDAVAASIKQRPNAFPIVFVGTSLGGFYAKYMSTKLVERAVLVNPATNPAKSLLAFVGDNTNYTTSGVFTLTEEHLEKLQLMQDELAEFPFYPKIDLFLAKDDTVLPYTEALCDLPEPNSVTVFEDGGHRFASHWDEVMDAISAILERGVN